MENLIIKNIVILGKFDDGLIRQVLCKPENQFLVMDFLRSLEPDRTIKVLDKALDGITWEYDENVTQ
jgi:hypothetical protein